MTLNIITSNRKTLYRKYYSPVVFNCLFIQNDPLTEHKRGGLSEKKRLIELKLSIGGDDVM